MKKPKFKVGDKVRYVKDLRLGELIKTGTVVDVFDGFVTTRWTSYVKQGTDPEDHLEFEEIIDSPLYKALS